MSEGIRFSLEALLERFIVEQPIAARALRRGAAAHLGVFQQPYLGLVLGGQKRLESRFSTKRILPYGAVHPGDLLLLKAASGPVVGFCAVGHVEQLELSPGDIDQVRRDHAEALCIEDQAFGDARQQCRFVVLMEVHKAGLWGPVHCEKRDRRPWVLLHERPGQAQAVPAQLSLSLFGPKEPAAPETGRMKRFAEREVREAIAYAQAGGQALHIWRPDPYWKQKRGVPKAFRQTDLWAHLFDDDRERLVKTVRRLGVRVIKIDHDGERGQHVDLCGRPLERALAMCGEED